MTPAIECGIAIFCGVLGLVSLFFLLPSIRQARSWSDVFVDDMQATGLPEPPPAPSA